MIPALVEFKFLKKIFFAVKVPLLTNLAAPPPTPVRPSNDKKSISE